MGRATVDTFCQCRVQSQKYQRGLKQKKKKNKLGKKYHCDVQKQFNFLYGGKMNLRVYSFTAEVLANLAECENELGQ